MIDDTAGANKLIEELKTSLPILACPTKQLYFKMKYENNIKIGKKQILKISDVFYLGDEGGIGCTISDKNSKEVFVVSLTHLRVIKTHPLSSKISEYQLSRLNKLLGMEYENT